MNYLYRKLLHCYKTLCRIPPPDSSERDRKIIVLYGPGICSLWYHSFPALFQNLWFPGDLRDGHLSEEFLACVGILHSSIPVPEFIDPVFTKTSPKRSFSLNWKRAFWLVFAKTGSIISGTEDISIIFRRFPSEKMKECVPEVGWTHVLRVLTLASAPTTIIL